MTNESGSNLDEELRRAKLDDEIALTKYSELYNFAPIGLFTLDKDKFIREINRTGEELLGAQRNQLLNRRFELFVEQDDRPAFDAFCHEAFITEVKQKCELRLIKSTGERVYARIEGSAIEKFGTEYRLAIIDITEHKEADETLRQLSEELEQRVFERTAGLLSSSLYSRSLIEASLDPLVTISPEGKITDVNEATEMATGRTRGELVGTDFSEYFTDPDAAKAGYQKVLKEGRVRDYPLTLRHASGKTIDVLYNAAVYRNEEGELQGVFAAARDVTRLKQVEAALREANETLEQRVESRTAQLEEAKNEAEEARRRAEWLAKLPEENPNPIMRVLNDGTVVYRNPAASVLAGWIGQAGHRISAPLLPLFNLAINKGQRTREHVELGDRTYSVLVVPILDKCYVNIYGFDITERKRLEDENMLKSKEELEIRVDERTAQLQEAKEAAEAATKAKAAFMANMSHEIRTPMTAIIGMISLLQGDDLTPEQRDLVDVISSGGDALLSIINQILDFSRLEREKIELENQPLHLPGIIEEALDLATPKAAEKKLNLAYIIDKKTPSTIIGDPNRIRQVLINLLDNAVKFTEKGEVAVLVTSKLSDSIHNIQFAVRDTGIGIPEDKMELLFKPFSQVDYAITNEYGGTDLGLAISKRLVKLMGGDIWLESKVSTGSTFYFNILAKAISGQNKVENIQPKFKGKRVLIVEDNKTNQLILGSQTMEWGLIPTVADSQKDALKLIRSEEGFDIVILEMDEPEIDGLGLGQKIRKLKKNIPLIKLTHANKMVESDIFDASLAKPIKPAQIYNILTEAFSEQLTTLPISKPAKKQPTHSQVKILLAEDDTQSQNVILQMLKILGFSADLATNGLEVLQALERRKFDIILMDVRLPKMSGLDATKIIRQRWPENGPIIIAVTAFGLEGDKEICLDAGMDDYLSKPGSWV